ncbi:snaclec botrocetin subunit beta-like [Amphibalanus amphitrite]|uniref:snaclec botrocetin subunit beta-like n=1 Tax=Amphibalanus amphitrite TaxID=1232801 RepID=UPI001C92AF01|nr:snaclec botrocetin subunit beta-like [Amphibalanus amphitrite]
MKLLPTVLVVLSILAVTFMADSKQSGQGSESGQSNSSSAESAESGVESGDSSGSESEEINPNSCTREDQGTCAGDTLDPCSCPDGFSRCAGRCYGFVNETVNFTAAAENCAALGAHLATPRSAEENLCYSNASSGFVLRSGSWMGYRGNSSLAAFVGEDGCGPVGNYSNFFVEPTSFDDNQCVLTSDTSAEDGKVWMNVPCAFISAFVCQLEFCYRPECE